MFGIVGCEESQIVMEAFLKKGHDFYSCDIIDCSGNYPNRHIKADIFYVIEILQEFGIIIDIFIGHPPCTYLSHAGNGYLNIEKYGEQAVKRKEKQIEAYDFFIKMYKIKIAKICIENPVGYVNSRLRASQIINPYFFGDSDKKRTCLWLIGLPLLQHFKQTDLFNQKTHVSVTPIYIDRVSGKKRFYTDAISGTSKEGKKLRSKTFPGIANAMADQWG